MASGVHTITPEMDRHNRFILLFSYLLIFLAAPVLYVGVVQAALCDKLGAGAMVSNLPSSAYFFGNLGPIFLSWLIPHRHEKAVVVTANLLAACLMALVFAALALPVDDRIRIAVVIGQGLILGFSASTSQVFTFQCLGRGMTQEGRAKALKLTFTLGPITAVIGSLGAQLILSHGISFLSYPYDFAFLYLLGVPCTVGIALLASRYQLVHVEDETRPPFFRFMRQSIHAFSASTALLIAWSGYLLWYATLLAMPNLSLYTKEALGRDPKEFSGVIMALRFGFKSLAGFALGVIALRWGVRAPLLVTVLLLGTAMFVAWAAPGYLYLLAFGLMGAGELGGAYFPNYVLALSSASNGTRNLSILTLATPFASLSPAAHGALTDAYGFRASFVLGGITALLALVLTLKLPPSTKATS